MYGLCVEYNASIRQRMPTLSAHKHRVDECFMHLVGLQYQKQHHCTFEAQKHGPTTELNDMVSSNPGFKLAWSALRYA